MATLPHFLKTKLLPPRLSGRVLPRRRLLERMRGYLDRPLTLICADAGCGKTTLVADFVRSCELPFVWYQIDPSDEDLAIFFGYLVYGLKRAQPSFGDRVLEFIQEAEGLASKTDQLVDAFVSEVSDKLEYKTLLVLDDYHHLDSSAAIKMAVDRLLQCLPEAIHLVITTRTMPNLSITRLKSKGLVGIIDRRDLLFSPQEIEQLFAEVFHHPLPPDMIDKIHKKTDGWITALQLIQQSFDQIGPGGSPKTEAEIASALERSDMEIFDYFAQEVLRFEEPDARLLLGRVSLLERIDPEACDHIFGAQNSREKLLDLSRRNIFIAAICEAGGEQEYRLHPLFRSFLKRWLSTEIGAQGIKQLHLKCAHHFAEKARWDLAAHHYAEASAEEELADLLSERGADLIRSGRFELIKRSFDALPQELINKRPGALIARADVALIEGDWSRAEALYARAERSAQKLDQQIAQAEALRGLAYVARYRGQLDKAIQLAESAIALAQDQHSIRARCFNIIGLCKFAASCDIPSATSSWRAALEEARLADDDRLARIILHNLGLPHSIEGDFNEAIRWLGQMLGEGERIFPQRAIAHLNIARLNIVQGRLGEAEAHLERAIEICDAFGLAQLKAETLEAFGNLYRERGDWNKSLRFYNEAARAYAEVGLPLIERELLDERATLYLKMGNIEAAERDAKEYYNARRGGSAAERSTALITLGRIEMAAGRADQAKQFLEEALSLSREKGLNFNLAKAATSLARLLWDSGQKSEAFEHLSQAAELSARYDYSYWLSCEAAQSPELFRAAIEAGRASEYLSSILPAVSAPRPAAIEPSPEQPYDLYIRMLGPIEVYTDPNEPMPEDTWRLLKSLHILCYIASRRMRRAHKESIIEAFWPDSDIETIARNFHPTISHLRKALNKGQLVKKDFILYREGAYMLNPCYRYWIDIEEFERLLSAAHEQRRIGNAEEAARAAAQAVSLYRGDFLSELYYDWVEQMQSHYRDMYLEALKELVKYHNDRGEYELAIQYGRMILQNDPYREDVHCQIMEAHVRSGNRAAAIEQFNKLRKALRDELGVEPLPATVAKFESLMK